MREGCGCLGGGDDSHRLTTRGGEWLAGRHEEGSLERKLVSYHDGRVLRGLAASLGGGWR